MHAEINMNNNSTGTTCMLKLTWTTILQEQHNACWNYNPTGRREDAEYYY